jgi:hypothetical protein
MVQVSSEHLGHIVQCVDFHERWHQCQWICNYLLTVKTQLGNEGMVAFVLSPLMGAPLEDDFIFICGA